MLYRMPINAVDPPCVLCEIAQKLVVQQTQFKLIGILTLILYVITERSSSLLSLKKGLPAKKKYIPFGTHIFLFLTQTKY